MNRASVMRALYVILVILLMIPSCTGSRKPYSKEELMERLSGEWKNTEYDLSSSPARRIIDRQGNLQQYDKTYEDAGGRTGKFKVSKAWTETEGLVWFKDSIRYDDTDTTVYELSKLDLQKMDWSLLWSKDDYPAEWDAVEYEAFFYRK